MSRNKGLFALENDDLEGDTATAEISTGEEAGTVAEVEVETGEDVAGVDEVVADLESGVDAGEQLEEVADGMQAAVDSGEGLTEVAAEAYRMALAAICKPLGADPKRFFQLYAKESFAAESARMANTSFALEGVKEFMTDLYKRIKAAMERLWKKVKAFWDKHISNLGRAQKAIVAMKARVKKAGKLKGIPHQDTMPSSLADAFMADKELTDGMVKEVITAHGVLNNNYKILTDQINIKIGQLKSYAADTNARKQGSATPANSLDKNLLVKVAGLTGGYSIHVESEGETDADDKTVTFTLTREVDSDKTPDTSKGMLIPAKEKLTALLSDVETELKKSITARKQNDKTQDTLTKALQDMHAASQGTTATDGPALRKAMVQQGRIASFVAKLSTTVASENVRVTRAVLSYVAYCLKSYS